jgi:hypothetical protein
MEEELKPNYFAIIPAVVRYNKNLTDKEKLIYAEITALSNKEGCCWASNAYFAELYNASERTIRSAITNLVEQRLIERKITYKKGSKEIEKRFLYPLTKISSPGEKNFPTPGEKICLDNNTSESTSHNISFTYMNNIKENKKHTKKEKEFIPPTVEEVKKYAEERNSSVDAEYFVDYYAANNWKDSKGNKVKNWKQKFITWDKRDKNSSQIRASVNYVDNPNDWSEGKEIFEEYYRQQEEESRKGK